MEVEHILRDLGLILGAGLLSQLIATLVRLPEMVVLSTILLKFSDVISSFVNDSRFCDVCALNLSKTSG